MDRFVALILVMVMVLIRDAALVVVITDVHITLNSENVATHSP